MGLSSIVSMISLLGAFSFWQWLILIAIAIWYLRKLLNSKVVSVGSFIAINIDILIAAVLWKSSDITISSHTGIAAIHGKLWGIYLCKFLNWLSPNHCANAITNDIARAEAAIVDLKNTIE